ncbi:FecR family protein [Pedobacter sp. GR22-6]|uniref:FecR family protein n=1 Tax=Pedobacter sp. GR22-6 TaxID=3127957 RepID=UPI00307CFDC2
MDNLQIKQLLQKYLDGKCTAEESALIEDWYLQQATAFQRPDAEMIDRNEQLMLSFLEKRVLNKKTVRLWPKIGIAAAIAFIVIGAYFFRSTFSRTDNKDIGSIAGIAPGKNGATLTLANGQEISIVDALDGEIASQSGVKISKTKEGQIIYELTDQGIGKVEYNTLTTTRGQHMQLRLPDGSLVFLNSASSLRYPTNFAKVAIRNVSLSGEGYFEIAKNKAQPFVVSTAKQDLKVLGTHFNVNAYLDEKAVKTTLLEGSVKVMIHSNSPASSSGERLEKILKPGQQSTLDNTGIKITEVNPDEAVAWQKGYFSFYNEDIASVMRKVSRWYNVEVEFSGLLPEVGFNARIDKYTNIRDVLGILEKSGAVHFKVEGRTIIVSK